MIFDELAEHQQTLQNVMDTLQNDIQTACNIVVETLQKGNKVLLAGNGGSASDAQHIAAELTGRYVKERRSLPGIALTTDTSALTAIGNDYGYDRVFARQLEGLGNAGDLFIGISTSGNSLSVINAFNIARQNGLQTLGLSGRDGGAMNQCCDLNIIIPSNTTARIQEMHILIGHILCKAVDNAF